jgi:hypothetical protein
MSAEHHQEHAERHEQQHEALAAERERRVAELREKGPEQAGEKPEDRVEKARERIHESTHEQEPAPDHHETEDKPRPHIAQLLNHKLNYADTLASVQRKLRPLSRGFSKLIHLPAVERTSDAVGSTLARPSVAAGSTWTALIIGIIFYFTARRYGYSLSGSELLISFVLGALLGLVLEGAWNALKRR